MVRAVRQKCAAVCGGVVFVPRVCNFVCVCCDGLCITSCSLFSGLINA